MPVDPTTFLFAPPLTPPFKHMGGIGAFGTRRWRDHGIAGFDRKLPSVHEAVDLVPAISTDDGAVYAAYWGEVVEVDTETDLVTGKVKQETITLWCDPKAAGVIFRYLHVVRGRTVHSGATISSGINTGDRVRAGQLLGFISPNVDRPDVDRPHLHFEMRVQVDPGSALVAGGSVAVPGTTMAVDPTAALYRFDAERWPRERNAPIEEWSMSGYLPITRLRTLPWVVTGSDDSVRWHTQTLLQVMFEEDPQGVLPGRPDFYLPVDVALPRERLMIDTLRSAFDNGQKVRLSGRRSYFFDDRPMIEEVSLRPR
jgi:hypothetical protein